jgi:acyl-coenzyme A synthetase/AMP-(fatty) acid ligase/acyl carrier protein
VQLLARFQELDARPPAGEVLAGRWSLTWTDALQRSLRAAAYLRECGLGAGDTLVVGIKDDAEVTTLFLACLRTGVVPVFLDPGATAAEVRQVLGELDIALMLADADRIEGWICDIEAAPHPIALVRPTAKRTLLSRWLGTSEAGDTTSYPACLDAFPASTGPEPSAGTNDLALILYTSGTSGGPKLVPLTRGNLEAQAQTMMRGLELGPNDRVLNLMPITHVDGLLTGILVSLWSGATMVRQEPFTIPGLPAVLDSIYRERVTHALLVPTILSLMLRDEAATREAFDSSDFRFVISTAASLAPELWERFETVTGKPVVNMYGLSEVGNVIFAGPAEATRQQGTIGHPMDAHVRVVDNADHDVSPGETGELLLRGASVMPGYLGRPTPWTLQGDLQWFATGDLVTQGANGALSLVGRKKHIIITAGNNVAPDEVNAALLEHPSVVEAATFGAPDDTWGERIVSCVVLQSADGDRDAVLQHVARQLAAFKVPRELHVVDELPKGRSGKVQLAALADCVREDAPADQDLEATVLDLAARSFHVESDSLSWSTGPTTCDGWDSMAHLDFVVGLESAFGLRFSPRDVMRLDSLSSALERVKRHKSCPS